MQNNPHNRGSHRAMLAFHACKQIKDDNDEKARSLNKASNQLKLNAQSKENILNNNILAAVNPHPVMSSLHSLSDSEALVGTRNDAKSVHPVTQSSQSSSSATHASWLPSSRNQQIEELSNVGLLEASNPDHSQHNTTSYDAKHSNVILSQPSISHLDSNHNTKNHVINLNHNCKPSQKANNIFADTQTQPYPPQHRPSLFASVTKDKENPFRIHRHPSFVNKTAANNTTTQSQSQSSVNHYNNHSSHSDSSNMDSGSGCGYMNRHYAYKNEEYSLDAVPAASSASSAAEYTNPATVESTVTATTGVQSVHTHIPLPLPMPFNNSLIAQAATISSTATTATATAAARDISMGAGTRVTTAALPAALAPSVQYSQQYSQHSSQLASVHSSVLDTNTCMTTHYADVTGTGTGTGTGISSSYTQPSTAATVDRSRHATADLLHVSRLASVSHSGTGSSSSGSSHRVDDEEEVEEVLPSMCFSLSGGRVTSIVATRDGAYVIAGFSDGAIRLFDMTVAVNGSKDEDDRYGHIIGRLEPSGGHFNNAVLNLQLMEQQQQQLQLQSCAITTIMNGNNIINNTTNSSGNNSSSSSRDSSGNRCSAAADCMPVNAANAVSHLFAGMCQGSNKMLVIDLRSLRDLKYRRGFITRAGLGTQTFSHSDSKLRGCMAIICVSITSQQPGSVSESAQTAAGAVSNSTRVTDTGVTVGSGSGSGGSGHLSGYVAVYRLMCGRSFGHFSVWEVTLSAAPVNKSSSANLNHNLTTNTSASASMNQQNTMHNSSSGSSGGNQFQYVESWQLIATGSVGAPSLEHGCFVSATPRLVTQELVYWGASMSRVRAALAAASSTHQSVSQSPSVPLSHTHAESAAAADGLMIRGENIMSSFDDDYDEGYSNLSAAVIPTTITAATIATTVTVVDPCAGRAGAGGGVSGGINMSSTAVVTSQQLSEKPLVSSSSSSSSSSQRAAAELFEVVFHPANKDCRTCLITPVTVSATTTAASASGTTVTTTVATTAAAMSIVASPKASKTPSYRSKKVSGCGKVSSLSSIHASSQDGSILFCGLDELIVCKYMPSCDDNQAYKGSVVAYELYSLSFNATTASMNMNTSASASEWATSAGTHSHTASSTRLSGGGSSGQSSRHLRQIESVSCTADGAYAVVTCSDNCVLLYSVCDVFGRGMAPTERHCSPVVLPSPPPFARASSQASATSAHSSQDTSSRSSTGSSGSGSTLAHSQASARPGYLTVLFQAVDTIKIEIAINYVVPSRLLPLPPLATTSVIGGTAPSAGTHTSGSPCHMSVRHSYQSCDCYCRLNDASSSSTSAAAAAVTTNAININAAAATTAGGSSGSSSAIEITNPRMRPHMSPDFVSVTMSYWLVAGASYGGVIRVTRLAELAPRAGSSLSLTDTGKVADFYSAWRCQALLPADVAVSGVGVNKTLTSCQPPAAAAAANLKSTATVTTTSSASTSTSMAVVAGADTHSHATEPAVKCVCGDVFTTHWEGTLSSDGLCHQSWLRATRSTALLPTPTVASASTKAALKDNDSDSDNNNDDEEEEEEEDDDSEVSSKCSEADAAVEAKADATELVENHTHNKRTKRGTTSDTTSSAVAVAVAMASAQSMSKRPATRTSTSSHDITTITTTGSSSSSSNQGGNVVPVVVDECTASSAAQVVEHISKGRKRALKTTTTTTTTNTTTNPIHSSTDKAQPRNKKEKLTNKSTANTTVTATATAAAAASRRHSESAVTAAATDKNTHDNVSSSSSSTAAATSSLQLLQQQQQQIQQLETSVSELLAERAYIVRKSDQRVATEREFRQRTNRKEAAWDSERARFNEQIAAMSVARWQYEQQREALLTSVTRALQGFTSDYVPLVGPNAGTAAATSAGVTDGSAVDQSLPQTLTQAVSESHGMPNSNSSGSGSGSSGSDRAIMNIASPTRNLIVAPFCIACQSHTASVAVLHCGHICLCREHAEMMQSRNQLECCPLCRQKASGFCHIQGIGRG